MPTVLHRLNAWASADPGAVAQRFKKDGDWLSISALELRDRVHHLAAFLEQQGLGPGEGGIILSYNRPEWVQFELATMLVGARSAGIYPNSTANEIQAIVSHSDARVLAVQDREYFQKLTGRSGDHGVPSNVRLVVVFDGDTSIVPGAVAFSAAVDEGRRLVESGQAPAMDQYLGRIEPRAGAIMIYTSGTTGAPKGALISQDNLVFASDVISDHWRIPFARGTMFSFLPLSHVAEKLQSVGVAVTRRITVNFCSKFENLSKDLVEVRPTLLLCVPRILEKMMETVLGRIARLPAPKRRLARWALAVNARAVDAGYRGQDLGVLDRLRRRIAERLLVSRIRRDLGLDRIERIASGAAALPAHVARWFRSLGLEILENFGQTETTGILCMTELGGDQAGTVGKPIPGIEFRIGPDGEILTKGRHVFAGYFRDSAATKLAFTADGWLATGDLAEVDSRGLVTIRGRKKEVLKTSGGKMVAPLPIEERLRASPLIGHACLVGEGRKYLSALITLSEGARAELEVRDAASLTGKVVTHAPTLAQIKKVVDEVNSTLAQYEQVKKFVVLPGEFTVAAGELTPTLKMKRAVIEARFKDVIDSMYPGSEG